jgi:fido (protein-threonine AMPylation protein)
LLNALKFYQKFVKVHPFYDANGRIARLITNFYLRDFNVSLNWSKIKASEMKFLHKLNQIHKTEQNTSLYLKYMSILKKYAEKFIIKLVDNIE